MPRGSRWDRARIREGVAVLEEALARHAPGSCQIQAAIAAVHAEADAAGATDWAQIAALYDQLRVLDATPIVALNAAVAWVWPMGAR